MAFWQSWLRSGPGLKAARERNRTRRRRLLVEGLEVRLALTSGPVAVTDLAVTDSAAPVSIEVLANDSDPDGDLDPASLAVAIAPLHGNAMIQSTIREFGDDGSPLGTGSGSIISSSVEADGSIHLQVSGYPDGAFEGAHAVAGGFTLYVRLDVEILTVFTDPYVFDFRFDGELLPGGVLSYNIYNQLAATPFVAWIDNTTGVGTPDMVLRNIGLPSIIYTPEPGFKGSDSFTYTVRDDQGAISNEALVTVTVLNRIPLAADDSVTTVQDTSLEIGLLANDTDLDGILIPDTLTLIAEPTHGTAVVRATAGSAVVDYTPAAGFIGSDSFTYTVRDDDSALSRIATVLIDVTDRTPVLHDDEAATLEGTPVTIDILANDEDPNLLIVPSTLSITSAPTRGLAILQQTGEGPRIVYTPATTGAATLVVDDPRDVDDGVYTVGRLSLREAIKLANADNYVESFRYVVRDSFGDLTNEATVTVQVTAAPTTITFAPSLTAFVPRNLTFSQVGDTFEGASAWAITSAITIVGPTNRRITLAGQGANSDLRAFLVKGSASLTLQNLTLSNWASDSNGGTIYVENLGSLNLTNSTISGSFAQSEGGAIYSEGTLTIDNSTLSGNRAQYGGALMIYGGATLTGSILANNRAVDGGGFHASGDKYPVSFEGITLSNCRLSGNIAEERGGGFYLGSASATLTNCLLVGNSAHDGGGFANSEIATLTNSTLIGNRATNGGGAYNRAGNGGCLPQVGSSGDCRFAQLDFTGSTISANSADRGGGIFSIGYTKLVSTSVTVNRALQGGGIFHDASISLLGNDTNDYLDLQSTTLSSNVAVYAGGGLFTNGAAKAVNSTFTRNVAYQGAAVYNELDYATLTRSTVTGNVSLLGPQLFNHLGVLTLTDTTVSDRARLRFLPPNGDPATQFVATSPGQPLWGLLPPLATPIVTARDGVRYALTAGKDLFRQLPGTGWTILGSGVLEYKIAPSGECFWLNDRHELYHAQPGYAGGLRSQDVKSFAMDSSGVVYWISNLPTPGNFASYQSLTAPLLDSVEEPEPANPPVGLHPPTDAEVVEATGLLGLDIQNVRIVKEKIVDQVHSPRYFPNIGLAQLHRVHYKVTVYYSTEFRADNLHVIYLTRNHLHRYVPGDAVVSDVLSPAVPQSAGEAAGNVAATGISRGDKVVSITAGPDGTLYKLGGDFDGWHGGWRTPQPQVLWRLVGSGNWEPLFRVYQFEIAPNNTLVALSENHELKRLLPGATAWTNLLTEVQSFSLAPDGMLFALRSNGDLRRLLPGTSTWSTLDTGVQSFAMGTGGTIYELNGQHQLKRLVGRTSWTVLDTGVQSFVLKDGALIELNNRGELKRLVGTSTWSLLDSGVQTMTMDADGVIYALNSRHELKRLTARFHWTVMETSVRSFQVAPNTDLYLLNDNGDLKRLKPGDHWNTLQSGVESFTIDFAGRVYALDGQQQLTMYAALPEGYYLLAPILNSSPHVALDPPDDDFILRAANIVPPSDQYFATGPEFPHTREAAAAEAIPADITSPVTNAHNIRIVKDKLADSIDSPRIFRPGGPAQLHHAYYRCTVYYTTDLGVTQQRVIYIDKDHLHMVGGPDSGTEN